MPGILQDLTLARRQILARPLMSAVVVASLAIGIGGNTAIFGVVDHVLLRPLPFPQADRVLNIEEVDRGRPTGASPARLLDIERTTREFDLVGAWYGESAVVTGFDRPFRIDTHRTFLAYPRLLGSRPLLGRHLTEVEERGKQQPVALIGERLWRERFNGSAAAIGRQITVGQKTFQIVGVLPAEASVNPELQLWAPEIGGAERFGRQARFLGMMGRMAPGASAAGASGELSRLAGVLAAQYPATDKGLSFRASPLLDRFVEDARKPVWILLAAVGFMLLIACLNVSGLLLTRAASRGREIGIRVALGASRGSLVRLLLAESTMLSLLGGFLGLFLAWWSIDLLSRFDLVYIPRLSQASLDWRVAGFAFLLSLLCSLLCGLVPAWLGTRSDIAVALRAQGDRGTAARGSHRVRDLFVVAEIALSLVLLTGATLLLKSLSTIRQTPVAAAPQQLLAVELSLPWNSEDRAVRTFYAQVLDEMRTLPGVASAGFTNALPYSGAYSSGDVFVQGEPAGAPKTQALFHAISAEYLQTMGCRLLSGRWLSEADREGRPAVALINDSAARRLFPGGSPLGRKLVQDGERGLALEIVGVVSSLPRNLGSQPFVPEVYQPFRQTYWPMASFVLRSPSGASAQVAAVREAVRRVDPNHVIEKIHTMDEHLTTSTALPRYSFAFVGLFASMAVFLAALGVYGIMAQRVSDRRREAGIRAALGASPVQVLRWTLSRGWLLLGAGLLLGAAGSAVVLRLIGSLLFGLDPFDPAAWGGALLFLAAAAGIANAIAGRRILSANPAQILKAD